MDQIPPHERVKIQGSGFWCGRRPAGGNETSTWGELRQCWRTERQCLNIVASSRAEYEKTGDTRLLMDEKCSEAPEASCLLTQASGTSGVNISCFAQAASCELASAQVASHPAAYALTSRCVRVGDIPYENTRAPLKPQVLDLAAISQWHCFETPHGSNCYPKADTCEAVRETFAKNSTPVQGSCATRDTAYCHGYHSARENKDRFSCFQTFRECLDIAAAGQDGAIPGRSDVSRCEPTE
ncbi:MAG: hypothetical protein H6718_36365 [Polyangiaceae bacterium]|nr:hypothetical protein [Polyangiaceae bacterium]MCB9609644.1 hypothetical protein [Polyangiaceae bacterium]